MSEKLIIVGGGQAALQLCDSMRRGGYQDKIELYCDEPVLPYQRPPLSKAYLLGDVEPEKLAFRKPDFFTKRDIDVHLATKVVSIDPQGQKITTHAGAESAFSHLALTTGTRVRRLPVPGAELPNVYYLRDQQDADQIKNALTQASSVVVIGGGFIGLEVAASCRKLGKAVVCIEAQDRLMGRVVSPSVSKYFADVHQQRGTTVCLETQVSEIQSSGDRLLVACQDGQEFETEVVVIGIGVLPNQELASDCGLECENGIRVDEFCCTSDPNIVAAGDCTSYLNPFSGTVMRLESVQNAIDQSKHAAQTLLGEKRPFYAVPWFWSDQFDLKLQTVGFCQGADLEILRGNLESDKFALFYFAGDKLIAVDTVNAPGEHMLARRLIGGGIPVTPKQVQDEQFDLKTLL